jgi:hypothetical protein
MNIYDLDYRPHTSILFFNVLKKSNLLINTTEICIFNLHVLNLRFYLRDLNSLSPHNLKVCYSWQMKVTYYKIQYNITDH